MFIQRVRNFLLLGTSLAYFLIRGRADKKVASPKSVLVVQLAKLGDMVCTTPVFRAIKKQYPECKVYVLGDSANEKLLEGNGDVDGYIIYPKKISRTSMFLRAKNFDFACMTGPNPEILSALYLAGIPSIVAPVVKGGFCPQQTRAYNVLKNFMITTPQYFGQYFSQQYLRLLEPIGIFSGETKKYLSFSPDADATILQFLKSESIDPNEDFVVGIAPGTSAGGAIKLWGGEKFARVADWLYKKHNAKIIILGGPNDQKEVEKTISFLDPSTKVMNSCGLFNIDQLKSFISRLSLLIAVDSGPLYIAEAFGVPTLDIIGASDEREQSPRGKQHMIVKFPERGAPALHVMNNQIYDEIEARKQIEDITPEMVMEAASKAILQIRKLAII